MGYKYPIENDDEFEISINDPSCNFGDDPSSFEYNWLKDNIEPYIALNAFYKIRRPPSTFFESWNERHVGSKIGVKKILHVLRRLNES